MRILLFSFLLASLYSQTIGSTYLLSDYDMTNQNYSIKQMKKFCQSYSNNKFTDEQIKIIYNSCKQYTIHPLVVFTKLEQENSLTQNKNTNRYEKRISRALAYGLYIKEYRPDGSWYCPNLGFELQITNSVRIIRKFFNAYVPGTQMSQLQDKGILIPQNAATWTLYRFCPVYGEYLNCGTPCTGNYLFQYFFYSFKTNWEALR